MGGDKSQEYHYLTDIGEGKLKTCRSCNHFVGEIELSECPKCKSKDFDSKNSIEVSEKSIVFSEVDPNSRFLTKN